MTDCIDQKGDTAGSAIRVQDASDVWHEAIAVSGVEPGHKFKVVWVKFTTRGDAIPWPAESVDWVNGELDMTELAP